MTIQNEITKQARLLDEKGHLTVSGWARDLLLKYDRKDIKARSYRIKEWDYYLVLADDFGCAFTISDLSYIGMVSVSFLDFKNLKDYTKPIITILPMGKYQMPSTSITGDVHFENKDLKLVKEKLLEWVSGNQLDISSNAGIVGIMRNAKNEWSSYLKTAIDWEVEDVPYEIIRLVLESRIEIICLENTDIRSQEYGNY